MDPSGVDTITPSLLSCQNSSPSMVSRYSISMALLAEQTVASLRTWYLFAPSTVTASREISSVS